MPSLPDLSTLSLHPPVPVAGEVRRVDLPNLSHDSEAAKNWIDLLAQHRWERRAAEQEANNQDPDPGDLDDVTFEHLGKEVPKPGAWDSYIYYTNADGQKVVAAFPEEWQLPPRTHMRLTPLSPPDKPELPMRYMHKATLYVYFAQQWKQYPGMRADDITGVEVDYPYAFRDPITNQPIVPALLPDQSNQEERNDMLDVMNDFVAECAQLYADPETRQRPLLNPSKLFSTRLNPFPAGTEWDVAADQIGQEQAIEQDEAYNVDELFAVLARGGANASGQGTAEARRTALLTVLASMLTLTEDDDRGAENAQYLGEVRMEDLPAHTLPVAAFRRPLELFNMLDYYYLDAYADDERVQAAVIRLITALVSAYTPNKSQVMPHSVIALTALFRAPHQPPRSSELIEAIATALAMLALNHQEHSNRIVEQGAVESALFFMNTRNEARYDDSTQFAIIHMLRALAMSSHWGPMRIGDSSGVPTILNELRSAPSLPTDNAIELLRLLEVLLLAPENHLRVAQLPFAFDVLGSTLDTADSNLLITTVLRVVGTLSDRGDQHDMIRHIVSSNLLMERLKGFVLDLYADRIRVAALSGLVKLTGTQQMENLQAVLGLTPQDRLSTLTTLKSALQATGPKSNDLRRTSAVLVMRLLIPPTDEVIRERLGRDLGLIGALADNAFVADAGQTSAVRTDCMRALYLLADGSPVNQGRIMNLNLRIPMPAPYPSPPTPFISRATYNLIKDVEGSSTTWSPGAELLMQLLLLFARDHGRARSAIMVQSPIKTLVLLLRTRDDAIKTYNDNGWSLGPGTFSGPVSFASRLLSTLANANMDWAREIERAGALPPNYTRTARKSPRLNP